MKCCFFLGLCFLIQGAYAIRADGEIKWGEPVNGLRLGIQSPVTAVTSDQKPVFTITVQNISTQPITIPTPDTFLLKSTPNSSDYHQAPLVPIIQETSPTPINVRWSSPDPHYSMSENGKPLKEIVAHVVTLAAGQSVTWKAIPLESSGYAGDRLPPSTNAMVTRWYLLPEGQYDIRFQFGNEQTQVAGVGVWAGTLESGIVHLKVNAPSTEGIKLEGSFSLRRGTYFLGEGMQATFTVKNKGDAPTRFLTGGDYSNSGRSNRYSIRAVDEQGHAVLDPLSSGGGGIGTTREVGPGETYTEKLLVNQWCAFSKPGKYKITFKRTLNIFQPDKDPYGFFGPESSLPSIPIETTLDVTIAKNGWMEEAYLGALAKMVGWGSWLMGDRHVEGPPFDLLQSNAAARLPETFTEIVRLLDSSYETQVKAVGCLSYYGTEKAGPVLIENYSKLKSPAAAVALHMLSNWNTSGVEPLVAAALRDPDRELRVCAVEICNGKWYGSCVPILLTMGNEPDPYIRYHLGAALGNCGDQRAIPVLLKLLHDSSPDPRMSAAEALGKFKRMEGVRVLIALLRDPPPARGNFAAVGNVMEVLKELTGKDFENRNAWLDWWKKTGRAKYEASPQCPLK